jgi:hypothetical protein
VTPIPRFCRECGGARSPGAIYCASCAADRRKAQMRERVRRHRARECLQAAERERVAAAERRRAYLLDTGWTLPPRRSLGRPIDWWRG